MKRRPCASWQRCSRVETGTEERNGNGQVWSRADRKHAAGGDARQRAKGARHARDKSGDTGRESDPPFASHVATPLRGDLSHSASHAEKLGAGTAAPRRARG